MNIIIKKLNITEYNEAFELVKNVFNKYEAPEYSQEGTNEFYNSLCNPEYVNSLDIYGAFYDDKIIGVIATKNCGSHIALFFVDEKHHKKGIGRKLFNMVVSLCNSDSITVNSSPYAHNVYHKLGFADTDKEQVVNGIRFIPMVYDINKKYSLYQAENCPCRRKSCIRHGNCNECIAKHRKLNKPTQCERKNQSSKISEQK